ncbi:MAG TPA: hypothetical protein VIM16_05860 [Mucilaginibacter sp.]|jgi:geranylgeranyl pyrophosphate synthase
MESTTKMARPKSNKVLPSATERVNKSIELLIKSGGKRLMLRLTADGYDALKTIMAIEEISTETKAINEVLIKFKQQLLNMPTK